MAANRFLTSPTFRFSIRQLLLGTALVAIACVALRSASPTWVAALLGLTLLALAAAVPLAIFRQGADRAWWFGFALFGWLYMLLLGYSWSLDPNTLQSNPLGPYSLATTQLSGSGYRWMHAAASVPPTPYYVPATTGSVPIGYPVTTLAPGLPPSGAGYASPVYATTNGQAFSFYIGPATATPTFDGPSHDDFVNVAHAFWAILIALCGGWFTCWVYKSRPEPPPSPGIPSN
jgi:hypothetical protein